MESSYESLQNHENYKNSELKIFFKRINLND